jgi:hypothetical protein
MQGQDVCQSNTAAYHFNTFVGSTPIAYAAIPRCNYADKDIEDSAAHELIEAVTDPYPQPLDPNAQFENTAYAGFDHGHANWEVFNGMQDEVADACEFFLDTYYQETGSFPYWVARSWSNVASKAGHDPCQPGIAEPYYNAVLFPGQTQTIDIDLSSMQYSPMKGQGFGVHLNESVTFQIGLFSDAPTSGPFTITGGVPSAQDISLTDPSGTPYDDGAATVTIDQPTGVNGQKAFVTVTPTKAGQGKFQLIVLTASLPGAQANHYLPVLIQNL